MSKYNDTDDLGESPSVDLFGLNEFGEVIGAREMWGCALGATVSTGVAIGARALGGVTMKRYSELIGLGAGVAVSGAMIAMPSTRAAGWTALVTSFIGNGFRAIEQFFTAPSSDVSGVVMERLDRYGNVNAAPLGATVLEPLAGAQVGAIDPPVDRRLNSGLPAHAGYAYAAGGPPMSGLAGHYGATMFGPSGR